MTRAPSWWRIRRWDSARVEALRLLFAVSRYCTQSAKHEKYRGCLSRDHIADVVRRHPWMIADYILTGRR
jgi:hypothetical protein